MNSIHTVASAGLLAVGGYLGFEGLGQVLTTQPTGPMDRTVLVIHALTALVTAVGGAAIAIRQLVIEVKAGEGPLLRLLSRASRLIQGKPDDTDSPIPPPAPRAPDAGNGPAR